MLPLEKQSSYQLCPKVLCWLWSVWQLVPWGLCGHHWDHEPHHDRVRVRWLCQCQTQQGTLLLLSSGELAVCVSQGLNDRARKPTLLWLLIHLFFLCSLVIGSFIVSLALQPYDETQFYICCEQCEDWYHGKCVGIMQTEADDIDDYICPKCDSSNVWNYPCQKNLSPKDYSELKKVTKSLIVSTV